MCAALLIERARSSLITDDAAAFAVSKQRSSQQRGSRVISKSVECFKVVTNVATSAAALFSRTRHDLSKQLLVLCSGQNDLS